MHAQTGFFMPPRLRSLGRRAALHTVARQRYAFREHFALEAAAPLASPLAAHPGPGSMVLVQNDGAFSISEGTLVLPPQTTPVAGDQSARVVGSFARADWPAFRADLLVQADGPLHMGWWPSTTLDDAPAAAFRLLIYDEQVFLFAWPSQAAIVGLSPLWPLSYLVVARPAGGALYLVRIPYYSGRWQLMFFDRGGTQATLYAGLSNVAAQAQADRLAVPLDVGPIAPDVALDAPASGTTFEVAGGAIYDFRITQASTLVAGARVELRYRVQDAQNYWSLATQVPSSGGPAELRLSEVRGGVVYERLFLAGTTSLTGAGASLWITLRHFENSHFLWTRSAAAGVTYELPLVYVSDEGPTSLAAKGAAIYVASGAALAQLEAFATRRHLPTSL